MTMKHKKSLILSFILLLAVILRSCCCIKTPRFLNKSMVSQSIQTGNKAQQITKAEAKLASIKNKNPPGI